MSGRVEAHLRGIRGCQAVCRMVCLRELIVDRLKSTPKAEEYATECRICLVKDCTMYTATRYMACYPLVGLSKGVEGHSLVLRYDDSSAPQTVGSLPERHHRISHHRHLQHDIAAVDSLPKRVVNGCHSAILGQATHVYPAEQGRLHLVLELKRVDRLS